MPKKIKNKRFSSRQFPSELRYDSVGKDWVVIATGRAKRPESFRKEKRRKDAQPKSKCVFCNIETQETPTLIYQAGDRVKLKNGGKIPKNWTTIVIPNKYPAVIPSDTLNERSEGGLHKKMNAVGYHEVIVTRHHSKQLGELSTAKIKELMDVFQSRYLSLKDKKFVNHISIFQNHGAEAGATISHPHSQLITTPLVDVDLNRSLANASRYFTEKGSCIYCKMIALERRTKTRIIFENKHFLVICPFASKVAFEMIITPKKHLNHFEEITEEEKQELAEAFREALSKLHNGLDDPAYNFYLHTAPCDGKEYPFYHWHWTILPKTSIMAGFELGTEMEISTIEPEQAAVHLKKQ